jgi:hypothetical protein
MCCWCSMLVDYFPIHQFCFIQCPWHWLFYIFNGLLLVLIIPFHSSSLVHLQTSTSTCQLVGQTELLTTPATPGQQSFSMPAPGLRIKRGDILGIQYTDNNPIPYDSDTCTKDSDYVM